MNILVVDDDGINRLVASELLSQDGHQVATADSGMEALSHIGTAHFDVVLMDLGMPGLADWRLRGGCAPRVSRFRSSD